MYFKLFVPLLQHCFICETMDYLSRWTWKFENSINLDTALRILFFTNKSICQKHINPGKYPQNHPKLKLLDREAGGVELKGRSQKVSRFHQRGDLENLILLLTQLNMVKGGVNNMAFEIDYIPVGNGESSGDAIALRFGNLSGARNEQTVVVIDGGYKESGEALVEHIGKYYDTNFVDLVISTHPDEDHASGLAVVLEKCTVGQLLMHKPWEHASVIKNMFHDGRITASGLEERLEKSLQNASDLETLAKNKGIEIIEPFQGIGAETNFIHVLGPSLGFYESLLPSFKPCPDSGKALGIPALFKQVVQKADEWVEDHLGIDLLNDDNDSTSSENNTSTVILFTIDGQKLLFTGDVGKTGMLEAVTYADTLGIPLTDLNFLDVPHHGSKNNLSSKVLSKVRSTTAFVSASSEDPKHPSKRVTNALKKQQCSVFINNKGNTICHNQGAPARPGWGSVTEEPFYEKFKDD